MALNFFSDVQANGAHIIIGDVRFESKGKNRRSLAIECKIPGMSGNLNSSAIGKVACDEVIDYISGQWEQGINLDGNEHTIKDPGVRWRKRSHNGYRRGNPHWKCYTTYRMILRQLDGGGFKKKRHTTEYIPTIFNTSYNISGLMLNNLKGRYRPARKNRDGTPVSTSWEFEVPASRAQAAQSAGLNPDNIEKIFATGNLPRTEAMLDKVMYWRSLKIGSTTVDKDTSDGLAQFSRLSQQLGRLLEIVSRFS